MNPEDIVTIQEPSTNSSAQVHLHGACLVSYQVKGREYIFVSQKAIMDGTKAIRGGLPIVFPIFGPPEEPSTMPQHGFARVNRWKLVEKEDSSATFGLGFADATEGRGDKNLWADAGLGENNPWAPGSKLSCVLYFTVKIENTKLITSLRIVNTGGESFPFQTLFHTYFQVANGAALDHSQCFISGLEGYSVVDKVGDQSNESFGSSNLVVEAELDRIFTPPVAKKDLNLIFGVGNNEKIKLTAQGMVDGSKVPVSCVTWNPHIEKSKRMSASDFGAEEYHDMLCVEPGILEEQTLARGQEAIFSQTIELAK